jgi:hypothetical protein
MNICKGNGECLEQLPDLTYDKLYKKQNISCNFLCTPVKCPNYVVCETIAPEWYFKCHDGVCVDCNVAWNAEKMGLDTKNDTINNKNCNKLKIVHTSFVCDLCGNTNEQKIKMVKCDHWVCIDCFNMCYFGKDIFDMRPESPVFPFPEHEDTYNDYCIYGVELPDSLKNNDDITQYEANLLHYTKRLDKWDTMAEQEQSNHERGVCRLCVA